MLTIMFVLFSALLMLGTLRLGVLGGPVNDCDCPNVDCTEKATPTVWAFVHLVDSIRRSRIGR